MVNLVNLLSLSVIVHDVEGIKKVKTKQRFLKSRYVTVLVISHDFLKKNPFKANVVIVIVMTILLININFLFLLQNATFRRFPLVSLLVILKRSQPERDRETSSRTPRKLKKKRRMLTPITIYFSTLKKAALVVFKGIPHWKNILPWQMHQCRRTRNTSRQSKVKICCHSTGRPKFTANHNFSVFSQFIYGEISGRDS